jgi:hypothetical protein
VAVLAFASVALFACSQENAAVSAPPPAATIMVIADESALLTPAQVAAEQAAIRLVGTYEPSPASVLSVIGFGSVDANGGDNIPAYDVVCAPAALGPPGSDSRDVQASCPSTLHRRVNDTDLTSDPVEALTYAHDQLATARPGQRRVILLLSGTRGARSSALARATPSPADRESLVGQQLTGQLPAWLRGAGIEVWPVSFGAAETDRSVLDLLSERAYQPTIDCPAGRNRPGGRFAPTDQDLAAQMLEVMKAARCAHDPVAPAGGRGGTDSHGRNDYEGVGYLTLGLALGGAFLLAMVAQAGGRKLWQRHQAAAGRSVRGLTVYLFGLGAGASKVSAPPAGTELRLRLPDRNGDGRFSRLEAAEAGENWDILLTRDGKDAVRLRRQDSTSWDRILTGRASRYPLGTQEQTYLVVMDEDADRPGAGRVNG